MIAVFIPAWNCSKWIERTIRSVLHQTFPNTDIYVVDDCSGDISDNLRRDFHTVTFIGLRKRLGPYGIANFLINSTKSEFVGFQDADDYSKKERFALQIDYMIKHSLDGCGCWYINQDLNGDPIGFGTPPEDASQFLRKVIGDCMLHPTVVYRRHVFSTLIGFDMQTRFSADTELHYRASLNGFRLANLQRFLYHRTLRPDSLTQNSETGLNSPSRVSYQTLIRQRGEEIRDGKVTEPMPGILLTGQPVTAPTKECIAWIRLGKGNSTLTVDPDNF
jgi:glycosyltransferase involved in cell wall biosynthesis